MAAMCCFVVSDGEADDLGDGSPGCWQAGGASSCWWEISKLLRRTMRFFFDFSARLLELWEKQNGPRETVRRWPSRLRAEAGFEDGFQ